MATGWILSEVRTEFLQGLNWEQSHMNKVIFWFYATICRYKIKYVLYNYVVKFSFIFFWQK
jgi:hypothetical protein